MAKKAVPGTQFGVAPKRVNDFVKEALSLHADIAKNNEAVAKKNGKLRQELGDVYADAKNAGLDKAAIKLAVKKELTLKKLEDARKALDDEQANIFDYIEQCRGRTGEEDEETPKASGKPADKSVAEAADRAAASNNVRTLERPQPAALPSAG